MKRRQNNEAQLEKELGRFFRKLKKSVLKELDEYWSDYQLLQGQVNLMLSPIHEAHKEYYEIIRKYKLREYELGKAEAKRLTKRANKDRVALKAVTTLGIQGFVDKDKNSLFGTIPKAEEDLLNRTFRASENTLNRVDNQLNQIISDGYREGKGINQVANDITQRFDQLADWEARRIARTEINTSHNQATRDQYKEDGVEYTQWIAANDDRTRDSHVDVDGEIIPIDGKYSNGLAFPGDTSGPIEEWINCRCSNAPFVIPYGFMAPSFSPFRESDLVPINTESLSEPSQEQLEQNLSPEQRTQYEQYTKAVNEAQAVIDSRFSLPRERLQARTQLEYNLSKLNQLKLVANGELARGYQGIIGAVTTPQDQQEAETVDNISNLKENLTDKEYQRYQKLTEKLEKYTTKLNNLPEGSPQRLMYEARIKTTQRTLQELEQKALNPTTNTKTKVKAQEYPIKTETPQEAIKISEEMGAKTVYSEVATNKRTYDVYEFEGFSVAMDRELMHSKNVATVDEIKTHMNVLPPQLRNGAKIRMSNIMELGTGGEYHVDTHTIELFNNGNRVKVYDHYGKGIKKHTILDVLTHESAHSYDFKNYDSVTLKGNIASKEVWGKIVEADNQLYRYKNPITGRMRTPKKFPTDYAADAWYSASRSSNLHKKAGQYSEDFAESTKMYLNPTSHDRFVEMFPNRAKFLESIYGKPNFKNYIVHTIKEKAVR